MPAATDARHSGSDVFTITEYVPGIPLYGFLRNKGVSDGTHPYAGAHADADADAHAHALH